MSTVDPRIARAQRARRLRGPRGVLLAAGIALAHVALWALAGFGAGQLLDIFRLMAINRAGDGWDSPYDGVPLLFLIGVLGGSLLGFVLTTTLNRMTSLAAAMIAPFLTAAAGLATGLALFSSMWTPPEMVGYRRGLVGAEHEPWDAGAWIHYTAPIWLPMLFAVIAFALAVWFALALARSHRKARIAAELLESGRKVRGSVTEVLSTGREVNGMPFVQFTVSFPDASGTTRWVTKKGSFPHADVPRAGDVAAVWFDPLRPDDAQRIMVGLGPDAASVATTP